MLVAKEFYTLPPMRHGDSVDGGKMVGKKKLVGSLIMGAALLLGLVAQFVPSSSTGEGEFFGATLHFYPWGYEIQDASSSDSANWFEEIEDDDDGALEVRAGMVLYYAAMAAGLVSLLALSKSIIRYGDYIGFAAAGAMLLAVILYGVGMSKIDPNANFVAGFYLSCIAGGAMLLTGYVAKTDRSGS